MWSQDLKELQTTDLKGRIQSFSWGSQTLFATAPTMVSVTAARHAIPGPQEHPRQFHAEGQASQLLSQHGTISDTIQIF